MSEVVIGILFAGFWVLTYLVIDLMLKVRYLDKRLSQRIRGPVGDPAYETKVESSLPPGEPMAAGSSGRKYDGIA